MKIITDEMNDAVISITVVDGDHKQTFSIDIAPSKTEQDELVNFAKGLRAVGTMLERQAKLGVASSMKREGFPDLETFGHNKDGKIIWSEVEGHAYPEIVELMRKVIENCPLITRSEQGEPSHTSKGESKPGKEKFQYLFFDGGDLRTKKQIEVMIHKALGGRIQMEGVNGWEDWTTKSAPIWNWLNNNFRVNPADKLRTVDSPGAGRFKLNDNKHGLGDLLKLDNDITIHEEKERREKVKIHFDLGGKIQIKYLGRETPNCWDDWEVEHRPLWQWNYNDYRPHPDSIVLTLDGPANCYKPDDLVETEKPKDSHIKYEWFKIYKPNDDHKIQKETYYNVHQAWITTAQASEIFEDVDEYWKTGRAFDPRIGRMIRVDIN